MNRTFRNFRNYKTLSIFSIIRTLENTHTLLYSVCVFSKVIERENVQKREDTKK